MRLPSTPRTEFVRAEFPHTALTSDERRRNASRIRMKSTQDRKPAVKQRCDPRQTGMRPVATMTKRTPPHLTNPMPKHAQDPSVARHGAIKTQAQTYTAVYASRAASRRPAQNSGRGTCVFSTSSGGEWVDCGAKHYDAAQRHRITRRQLLPCLNRWVPQGSRLASLSQCAF
jgi:hypothetical protein